MLLEAAMAELSVHIAEIPSNSGFDQHHLHHDHVDSNIDSKPSRQPISLLEEDQQFVSRVLNREPSSLGESDRLGYKSTVLKAGGGVPFEWEAEPGKAKSNGDPDQEKEEAVPPLSLPPIRLSSAYSSPSPSPSPRSLTEKMKNLLHNMKRGDNGPEPVFSRSSSSLRRSFQRRRQSKSPLSFSEMNGSLESSCVSSPHRRSNSHFTPTQDSKTEHDFASPLGYTSDSLYYFSPLSNSSANTQDLMSPRRSTMTQSSNGSAVSHPSSISPAIYSNTAGSPPYNGPDTSKTAGRPSSRLATCLFNIAAIKGDEDNQSSADRQGAKQGRGSHSFASPELEVLDERASVSTSTMMPQMTTLAEFISRGGPSMQRSFSTSRVTFAEDYYNNHTVASNNHKKYFSGQLGPFQHRNPHALNDSTCSTLDQLFPLKRPNSFTPSLSQTRNHNLRPMVKNLSMDGDGSPDQGYMDALDTSLDGRMDNEQPGGPALILSPLGRPAQEVVQLESDEKGFAYSPVSSAFVFSPRRAAVQPTYFNSSATALSTSTSTSTSSSLYTLSTFSSNSASFSSSNGGGGSRRPAIINAQPKPILKKSSSMGAYSHELGLAGGRFGGGAAMNHHQPMSQPASPKISAVLLRFAEAEEQLYHRRRQQAHAGPACLPMCSFWGKAFMCRSKLATTHSHLHG